MANRFWVGGTGYWGDAANHWSNLSGGTPSAAYLPTTADNVVFDSNSNSGTLPFTVTVDGLGATPSVCNDFFVTPGLDGAMTMTWYYSTGTGGATLNYYGNWTSPATNFSCGGTGQSTTLAYKGTGTSLFTNNGSTSFNINHELAGTGTTTLGSNYYNAAYLNVSAGTFTTSASNFTMTVANFYMTGVSAKTITLNSSTVAISGSVSFSGSNLTFNNTSAIINFSPSTGTFDGGGYTWRTVNFTSVTGGGNATINGTNTFYNLTISKTSSAGNRTITLGASQIITGTLTLGSYTNPTQRLLIASSIVGTQRTVTVTTLATLSDVDFRDIVAAGTSGTWSGTRLGNGGNNSNITFDAGKTVYWNLAGAQAWTATAWCTSTDGGATLSAPAINNFPLAQDTAIFNTVGSVGTVTINSTWQVKTVDLSLRTSPSYPMTMTCSNALTIYGDWKNGTGCTFTGTGAITFAGQTTQNLYTTGATFTQGISQNNGPGTVILSGALTTTGTLSVLSGTFNAVTYAITVGSFTSTGSLTRSILFGSGTWTITGSLFSISGSASITVGSITINMTSASPKTFSGGGKSYPTLNQGGEGWLTISGSNSFENITNSCKNTIATSIYFTRGTVTTVNNFEASGGPNPTNPSAPYLLYLSYAGSTPGTWTLVKASGVVSVDYVSLTYSTASGGATFYAGSHSVNNDNNTGWIFTAPPPGISTTGFLAMWF